MKGRKKGMGRIRMGRIRGGGKEEGISGKT